MRTLMLMLVLAGLPVGVGPAEAQYPAPIPRHRHVFASWQPPGLAAASAPTRGHQAGAAISRRGRRALIAGTIGAVAGLAVCTAISNMTDEGAEGFSTCTWKGYLLTGGIGFGVGFAAGWLL